PLDGETRVVFVIVRNLGVAQRLRHRNFSAKVVSVCGAHAWDRHSRLGPRGCVLRMCMNDPANLRKHAIKNQVSWQIRRRLIVTFNNLATEIADYHIFRLELLVWHTARLDHHEPLIARDAAGIAKREENKTASHNLEVGLKHLLL